MDVVEDLVEGVDLFRNKRYVLGNIRLHHIVLLNVELALSDGVHSDPKLVDLPPDFLTSIFYFFNSLLDLFYLVWVTLLVRHVWLHQFELATNKLSELMINEPFQIFFCERPIVVIDITDENPFKILHYVHHIPVNLIVLGTLSSSIILRFNPFVQQTQDLIAFIIRPRTKFGVNSRRRCQQCGL